MGRFAKASGYRHSDLFAFGNGGIGWISSRIPSLLPYFCSAYRTKSDRSSSPLSLIEKSDRRRFPLPGFSSMKIMELEKMCSAGLHGSIGFLQALKIRETAMTTKKRAAARIQRAERIVFFLFDVSEPPDRQGERIKARSLIDAPIPPCRRALFPCSAPLDLFSSPSRPAVRKDQS